MAPEIATLLRMMPDGYEEACFSTGAIVRKRDIKSPDDLMIGCLSRRSKLPTKKNMGSP